MSPDAQDPVAPDLAAMLARLVGRGVLSAEQAQAVGAELRALPGTGPFPAGAEAGSGPDTLPAGLRRRFAEIAGYLGGAFVVGATFLFLGQEWDALGRSGRFGVLAVMAVLLFVSGLAVRAGSGGTREDVRRRLASTLMTGAAGAAGFATFVILERNSAGPDAFDTAMVSGAGVATALAAGGYALARSAAGQFGMALAALWAMFAVLEVVDVQSGRPFGVGTLVLGVVWSALVAARALAERRFGLAVAVTLGLLGAQLAIDDRNGNHYLGYVLTALVAIACFAGYTRVRDWVLLAGGVVGTTLVVPEVLYDVTDGSLGASGVMLAAGVALLAASLAGLRMRRQESGDVDGPEQAVGA